MANMKYVIEIPGKNMKAVAEYYGTAEMNLDVSIGRKTVTLSYEEVMDLYTWLKSRLGDGTTMANTDKTLETRTAVAETNNSDESVATEARRGIIDMSAKLSSPKKIIVKTS